MKIYILAGETSGDIHGAELIQRLIELGNKIKVRAMGGPLMKKAGADISFDYRKHAIMGFVEVIKNIRTLRRHLIDVEKDIRAFNPDKVIMIDFPGFNLRIAKKIHKNFSLHYYIAPKAWAWKSKRAVKLAQHFDTVSCILPFEVQFFHKYGVNAIYVGNPSKSQVARYLDMNEPSKRSIKKTTSIALFPGSRKQEIERILPVMLEAIRGIPNIEYRVSQAPNIDSKLFEPFLESDELLYKDNYNLLHESDFALVTSGTATLETALFNVPQVVCYIANPISYFIGRLLVKVKYISLVNLILDKECVPELIQEKCTIKEIRSQLQTLISNEGGKQMMAQYKTLQAILGNKDAAKEAARNIIEFTSS